MEVAAWQNKNVWNVVFINLIFISLTYLIIHILFIYVLIWSNAESPGNSATLTSFNYSTQVGITSLH